MGDLKLHGFPGARLEPCDPARLKELTGRFPPVGAQPEPDAILEDGKFPLDGPAVDSTGWTLFNIFEIKETEREEWSANGAVFVVVPAGERGAIVRSILERNGAEAVRHLPLPA